MMVECPKCHEAYTGTHYGECPACDAPPVQAEPAPEPAPEPEPVK